MAFSHETTVTIGVHNGSRWERFRVDATVYADQAGDGLVTIRKVLARIPASPSREDCMTFQVTDLTPLFRETDAGASLRREIEKRKKP
jgi:hypothetical protein